MKVNDSSLLASNQPVHNRNSSGIQQPNLQHAPNFTHENNRSQTIMDDQNLAQGFQPPPIQLHKLDMNTQGGNRGNNYSMPQFTQ